MTDLLISLVGLLALLLVAALVIIPINFCGLAAREHKKYLVYAGGLLILLAGLCVPVFLLRGTPFSISVKADDTGAAKDLAIKETPYETTFKMENVEGSRAFFKDGFGHLFCCQLPNRFAPGVTELKLVPLDASLTASLCYIKHLDEDRYLIFNKDHLMGVAIVLGAALFGLVGGLWGYYVFPKPSFG